MSGQLEPLYRAPGSELIPPAGSSYYVVLINGTTELGKYGFDANLDVEAAEAYKPTIGPFVLALDSLSWLSDRDGALGAGGLGEVTLSEGTHTITLDASGGAASATTTVVVKTPPEKSYTFLPLVLRKRYGSVPAQGRKGGNPCARDSGFW
jgi:hypothetical protein